MADFEAPSFSLGIDFDLFDSDSHIPAASGDNKDPSASNRLSGGAAILEDDDDNDFETLTVVDSDTDNDGSRPKLKRLRRGSAVDAALSSASVKSKANLHSAVVVDDDDIEEFSSPEDNNHTDEHLSTQHHSVSNSSKFPLNVLTKQLGKRKQNVSNAPDSVITSCNNPPFPKLTISPLRRFQLIDSDSDSDDPSISEDANTRTCNGSESSLNPGQPNLVQRVGISEQGKFNESINTSTSKDLWKDFQPVKSFHIPTPALDEVCEEYFRSMKDKSKPQSNTVKSNQNSHVTNSIIDLGDPLPPAHQYFFHDDLRVQELVRTRLPNFFPLNAANRDSEQPSTSNIDYMGQFSHGEKSKQAARTNKAETSSSKNSRKSKTQEMTQGSVNPKLGTGKGIPKDAGKRRVQADGQAAGHWFTGPDGRRVYVSKNGQELTGRAAYILYKKESGAGFKKTKAKKKASTKKK